MLTSQVNVNWMCSHHWICPLLILLPSIFCPMLLILVVRFWWQKTDSARMMSNLKASNYSNCSRWNMKLYFLLESAAEGNIGAANNISSAKEILLIKVLILLSSFLFDRMPFWTVTWVDKCNSLLLSLVEYSLAGVQTWSLMLCVTADFLHENQQHSHLWYEASPQPDPIKTLHYLFWNYPS